MLYKTGFHPVPCTANAFLDGTIRTAIKITSPLDTVPDDATTAVFAYGRKRLNRTLEAIESVLLPFEDHIHRFVIFISTYFTTSHNYLLSLCADAV